MREVKLRFPHWDAPPGSQRTGLAVGKRVMTISSRVDHQDGVTPNLGPVTVLEAAPDPRDLGRTTQRL